MEQTSTQGEYRELTPAEIGNTVSEFRALLGLKQLALAAEAGVTERTIQRIEAGQRVDSETLRRVAKALKLTEESFIGPRYIKAPEVAAAEIAKNMERFSEESVLIEVQPVTSVRHLDSILQCHCWLIDDSSVADAHLERTAILKENIQDYGDCWSAMGPTARLEGCRELLREVQAIESEGYGSRYGTYCSTEGLRIGALVFIPKSEAGRLRMTQMIAPRSVSLML